MALEAKRFRHLEVTTHQFPVGDIVATGSTPLPAQYAACKDIGDL